MHPTHEQQTLNHVHIHADNLGAPLAPDREFRPQAHMHERGGTRLDQCVSGAMVVSSSPPNRTGCLARRIRSSNT